MQKWFKWRYVRHIFQALFLGAILNYSWAHHLIERGMPGKTGPIDCICPMGSFAMLLPQYLKQGGEFIRRSGNTNIVILVAFVLAILTFGGAFCGWMCPAGAVQEWLNRFRKLFWKKDIKIPYSVHKVLKWTRYAVLALILVMTYLTADFWFKAIDPYNTLVTFGQEAFPWGHETSIVGLVIFIVLILTSLFIERPCQYACPLSGIIHPVSKASAAGIVRNEDKCIDCGECDSQCPYQIKISTVDKVNRGECIQCLRCIDECPVPGALEVGFGWATGGAR
ncbi:MAG TPA: 4Fe-4S binding protein [Caldisericia bacterium]|mgnify:CR=1 FL=1|nr:4Fe-4S binding protein [Caldisericia bacterium]HPF48277.1 4Fe-4S binding protein [Caldisericia bacterium]HPI83544.1 4Fe-4S binding protein [Caldisericia bacterium]HPQ92730.1 4Fe-4S binding protein [Caldisericia bacterium]HRV74172.1 4Fe-4S binding protein [Caldisericia bacterium]